MKETRERDDIPQRGEKEEEDKRGERGRGRWHGARRGCNGEEVTEWDGKEQQGTSGGVANQERG